MKFWFMPTCDEVSVAFCEKAKKLGYNVNVNHQTFSMGIVVGWQTALNIRECANDPENKFRQEYKNLSIAEAFKAIEEVPEVEKIKDWEVEYFPGHIKVGCQRVNNELVRKIASKLKD